MNVFSFITISGSGTLPGGWKSVLIIPVGSVTITNSAHPPESITITSPLGLGNGSDIYDTLIISGNATLITNGDANAASDAVPGYAIWGAITGNPVDQADIQNGTLQGTFTPVNSAIVQDDTFKVAFQKAQGQLNTVTGNFIPYINSNYVLVNANGNAVANGTALLAALALAKTLTPNGATLSASNRAVVYLLAGSYDLGSGSLAIGQFIDLKTLAYAKDVIITSSNATGTIQVANLNDYILDNLTINNTNSGGSIVHNAAQTDNGTWSNLTLNANTFEGTTFAGTYKSITGTVDNILNGNISGTVSDSSFANKSCGYNAFGASVTISGIIWNCTGIDSCFGSALLNLVVISGTIRNCSAGNYSFGFSNSTTVTISGKINNCASLQFSFAASFTDMVTISGTIFECSGDDYCFSSSSMNAAISGVVSNCIAKAQSFCYAVAGTHNISGTVENCMATINSFGDTSVGGKIISCTRTAGYGTHAGTIDKCTFSANDGTISCLTVAAGAIVRYSTIYQAGAGQCIDGANGITVSIYQCSQNKVTNITNVTNNIATPFNVVDSHVTV